MQFFGSYLDDGISRVHSDKVAGTHAVALADDATILLSDNPQYVSLIGVFETANGFSAWFGTGYNHVALLSSYGGTTNFGVADTDGRTCIISSGHDLTFKNRTGGSASYMLYIFGGYMAL
jgi:hypothetical protein